VQLHGRRPQLPTAANDIHNRLSEISYSSALFFEAQGIALAKREGESTRFGLGHLERKLRQFNMHLIDSQELMSGLSMFSKLNPDAAFINMLRDEGRKRADAWLAEKSRHLDIRSSFTLDQHLY